VEDVEQTIEKKDPDYLLTKLNNFISGSCQTPLTIAELASLCSDPSPKVIALFGFGLSKRKLDPNILLLAGLTAARQAPDLLPIALALRYQANPNMYIELSVGNLTRSMQFHSMAYVYKMISDKADSAVIDAIIVMLYISGATDHLPVTSTTGGGIDTESIENLVESVSVSEWINGNYQSILIQLKEDNYYVKMDPTFLAQIGTLMDRPDLISKANCNNPYHLVSLTEVLRAWSQNVLESIVNGKHGNQFYWCRESDQQCQYYGMYSWSRLKPLRKALSYFNCQAFFIIIASGYIPDYSLVNEMIIHYQNYQSYSVLVALILKMLVESIKYGAQLDNYQFDILRAINSVSSQQVATAYTEPHWQKVCRLPDQSKNKLRGWASQLDLDPHMPPSDICQELQRISRQDIGSLKEAAIRRQMLRISTEVSSPDEVIQGVNQRALLCRNRAMEQQRGLDPYAVADMDMAFYRDQDGGVYCYTSDKFQELKRDGTNPLTRRQLPASFLRQLSEKQTQIEAAGLPDRDSGNIPPTYEETIRSLRNKDQISNDQTIMVENQFFQTGRLYGITKKMIDCLETCQFEQILKAIGSDQDGRINLKPLTPSHQRVTFIRIAYQQIKENPDKIEQLFSLIISESQ